MRVDDRPCNLCTPHRHHVMSARDPLSLSCAQASHASLAFGPVDRNIRCSLLDLHFAGQSLQSELPQLSQGEAILPFGPLAVARLLVSLDTTEVTRQSLLQMPHIRLLCILASKSMLATSQECTRTCICSLVGQQRLSSQWRASRSQGSLRSAHRCHSRPVSRLT